MSEIDLGIKPLKHPEIRAAAEAVAGATEKLFKDTMPKAVVSAAEKAERIGADFLSNFDQGYPHVPVRNLATAIRTGGDVTMRSIDGPSRAVFDENNKVQHVLFNRISTDAQRADHLLTAGYANLIHDDVLAKEAAGKVIGQSAGFISHPIERFATQEEMQKNAIDGARAYVGKDAANANKFTDYLTERFGARTEEDQSWGRHIVTGNGPESVWGITQGPPDSLLKAGVPLSEGSLSAQNKAVKGVAAHGWPVTRPGGVRLLEFEKESKEPTNEAMEASLRQAGRIIPGIKSGDLDRATTEGLSYPVKSMLGGDEAAFKTAEGRNKWQGLIPSDLVESAKASWVGKVQKAFDPEKIRKAAQALESDLPFWGS